MFIHVVQRGETLRQLAHQYGTSVNRLMAVNELPNPNKLVIGQAIIIPTGTRTHTIQPGENLWTIARNYGTTVQAISQANGITNPGTIYPGMVLVIPSRKYTVRSGDTLWEIAQRFDVSVQAIANSNNINNPAEISPGMVLEIPVSQPLIDVNGFITKLGEAGRKIVSDAGEHLTYVSPFAYRIQSDGGLTAIKDDSVIQAARSTNVVPMMAITNFSSTEQGSDLAHTILTNADLQETLLSNIIKVMKSNGYRGINFDFEGVLAEDRENYNQFLRKAVKRLHAEGYFVSTSLAPKTSASQQGLLYEGIDYAAQGKIVDFVILMTYEWGYRKGPPRAISPINLIRQVLDYAVTAIPRNKILMGVSTYARDWKLPFVQGQTEAETFSPQEAIQRAVRYGAVIQYNQQAQSPFYRYVDESGNTHEVWFEDARSVRAKFQTVKDYNLRGLSYWVLNYPFPQNWVMLENMFRVRKRTS